MASSQSGSFRFFRVSGIQVYVHWSWFVIAWIVISTRQHVYSSPAWNVAEYLGLFLIVLLHEFGHVLACRQVGGVSNEIVLWPLGGVALGRPPPRAAAELWTIVAGPLVNVVLWPVLMVATWWCGRSGLAERYPDFESLLFTLFWINKRLLFFNLLPIFPLDGGQILRSLLWFRVGRARSLQIAAVVGLAILIPAAAYILWRSRNDTSGLMWTGVMAFFIGQQCFAGLQQARALLALERRPRHAGFACPSCDQPPPGGPIWRCSKCAQPFDAFSTRGVCPHCQVVQSSIPCAHCGAMHPITEWEGKPVG